ncbi:MAG: ATP-dependent helicase [Candidatus Dojkabacteria bacterium]|nr:ATP-dependent helicase [Candidatus Dojkabacteria bacterium]
MTEELNDKKFVKRVFKIGINVDSRNEKKPEVEIEEVEAEVKTENVEIRQAKSKKRIPSEYQEKIYEFIKNQVLIIQNHGKPQNLMCKAGAGCGKSTTLVESLNFIPKYLNVIFLAFNKDIVEALRSKVPTNCRVQTFHSAGFAALRYRFKNVKLDDKKMLSIFQNLMDTSYRSLTQEESGGLLSPFLKLVGLLKNTLVDSSDSNLLELIDKYNIEIEDVDENILFELIREGLRISNSNPHIIDYNDMIYLPIKLGLSFFKVDVCFVDETQDLNNAQLVMIRKMVKDNGLIVMVGDPNQSIYGFRGADIEAMQRMKEELKAEELPLMETYRCGKKIVDLARELVPDLVAYSENPDGEIKEIVYDQFYELVKEKDMVLCRNNAPMIKPVFHLLAQGVKVSIKGRDIGEGLVRLVKKLKAFTMEDFYTKLDKWKAGEEKKARRRKSDSMMQQIEDKYECLMVISEDCKNVNEIIAKIEKIFSDDRSEIIFSSIHRAKGLESERVFILEPQLIPSKHANKEWEIQQERNILYVAITRTKMNLYLVAGEINTKF